MILVDLKMTDQTPRSTDILSVTFGRAFIS